jgi:hypothetical protein
LEQPGDAGEPDAIDALQGLGVVAIVDLVEAAFLFNGFGRINVGILG